MVLSSFVWSSGEKYAHCIYREVPASGQAVIATTSHVGYSQVHQRLLGNARRHSMFSITLHVLPFSPFVGRQSRPLHLIFLWQDHLRPILLLFQPLPMSDSRSARQSSLSRLDRYSDQRCLARRFFRVGCSSGGRGREKVCPGAGEGSEEVGAIWNYKFSADHHHSASRAL